jgi:ABC-2 type transport system ATP-binding protein
MTPTTVQVDRLQKTYRVPERQAGLQASLRALVRPSYREVEAVRPISFDVQAGEIVGLIGPNGAGKTTTLKMLCGLLQPTAGQSLVAGYVPGKRRPEFLRSISMVLGNKSQLLWDIPALDTFRVLGEIYAVPRGELQRRITEMAQLLEMEDLLTRPVRNLSLGERMKCELVAGLLHRPQMLFLDEPTLGLDVSTQARLRRFIASYNQKYGATILLTSHYMADVTALCTRLILLHHGEILYDGPLAELSRRLAPYKLIRLTLDTSLSPNGKLPPLPQHGTEAGGISPLSQHGRGDGGEGVLPLPQNGIEAGGISPLSQNGRGDGGEGESLPPGAEWIESDPLGEGDARLTLRVERQAAPAATAELLARLPVVDLAVEDPPIEAVIDRIYQQGSVSEAAGGL